MQARINGRIVDLQLIDGYWTYSFNAQRNDTIELMVDNVVGDTTFTDISLSKDDGTESKVKVTGFSIEPKDGTRWFGITTTNADVQPKDPSVYKWSPFMPKGVETDIKQQIGEASDSTIAQKNKLEELQALVDAELKAKASIDAIKDMEKQIQAALNALMAAQRVSEQDLVTAAQRAIKAQNDILDMKERWNFIDTFMSASNEGLILGSKDGSHSVRISKDGISFYSAGAEVASITGGMLKIDNGTFTVSLQIGHFKTEMYKVDGVDKHMNVVKYFRDILGR